MAKGRLAGSEEQCLCSCVRFRTGRGSNQALSRDHVVSWREVCTRSRIAIGSDIRRAVGIESTKGPLLDQVFAVAVDDRRSRWVVFSVVKSNLEFRAMWHAGRENFTRDITG